MKTQFANGREQLNEEDWKIEILDNQGYLSESFFYLSLQAENQYGRNYLIISELISVNTNDAIEIKINPSACLGGEGWKNYIVGYSTLDDPQTFIQIAKIEKPSVFNQTISLIIENDEQLNDDFILPNLIDLEESEYHGKIIFIEETNYFYEFNKNTQPFEYNSDFIESPNGTWIRVLKSLCYIDDISGENGCRRDVSEIKKMPNNKLLNYELGNESDFELLFYLENEDNVQINANRVISIVSLINNFNVSNFLNNLIIYNIRGYVTSNFDLRTQHSATNVNIQSFNRNIIYSNDTPIKLPDVVKQDEKILIGIKLDFTSDELNVAISDNSNLSLNFYLLSNAKRKSPIGFLLGGNFVLNIDDLIRVYPYKDDELLIKSGKAVINEFEINRANKGYVKSLPLDTENIRILLDQEGNISNSLNYSPVKPTRAIVSTKKHESFITDFKTRNISLNTNQKLNFDINLEKTEDDTKQLNPLFPDVISENKEYWGFNFKKINLYLRFTQYDDDVIIKKEYYKLNNLSVGDNINSYEINSFKRLEKIDESLLPINNHSLFHPGRVENIKFINSGLSVSFTNLIKNKFATDYIEIGIAFSLIYDGTIVSNISHNPKDGTIKEIKSNVFDVLSNRQHWESPILKTKLSQFSKHSIENGTVRQVELDNGEFETYVFYKEGGKNFDYFIKPFNANSIDTCAWVKHSEKKSQTVQLEKEIKKQIKRNSIIFG